VLAVEEMLNSLVQKLEATGALDNTFIFFTSDNGWQQGEHRITSGKNRACEESARVPLFVRGPGVPAGSKTENLTVNTDFAPTFAALAGVEFPANGRSLAPLLRGEDLSWRSAVLLERLYAEEGGGEGKGKGKGKGKKNKDKAASGGVPKSGPGGGPPFEAIRTDTHKYVEYESGEKELYDLQADPYELDNIYETADPALVQDLKTKLDALESCTGVGCREAEDGP
jgi:N-acetylglucosamine-6-sulfatase